jgi:DNA repair exonuclease SbcCD ATPase subunit
MPDEKDRLKEELHKREKASEDKYFAELSRKQVEKLRSAHAAAEASGHGKCPRCGTPLQVMQHKGVAVDGCPNQHGLWLDAGELDVIAKREGDSWLARLLLGARG